MSLREVQAYAAPATRDPDSPALWLDVLDEELVPAETGTTVLRCGSCYSTQGLSNPLTEQPSRAVPVSSLQHIGLCTRTQ